MHKIVILITVKFFTLFSLASFGLEFGSQADLTCEGTSHSITFKYVGDEGGTQTLKIQIETIDENPYLLEIGSDTLTTMPSSNGTFFFHSFLLDIDNNQEYLVNLIAPNYGECNVLFLIKKGITFVQEYRSHIEFVDHNSTFGPYYLGYAEQGPAYTTAVHPVHGFVGQGANLEPRVGTNPEVLSGPPIVLRAYGRAGATSKWISDSTLWLNGKTYSIGKARKLEIISPIPDQNVIVSLEKIISGTSEALGIRLSSNGRMPLQNTLMILEKDSAPCFYLVRDKNNNRIHDQTYLLTVQMGQSKSCYNIILQSHHYESESRKKAKN